MSEAGHGHDTGRAVSAPLRAGGQRKQGGELGASGGRAVGSQGALPTETGVGGPALSLAESHGWQREPRGRRGAGSAVPEAGGAPVVETGDGSPQTRPSRPSVSVTAHGLPSEGRELWGAGEAVSLMSRGGHLCVAVRRHGVPTRRGP